MEIITNRHFVNGIRRFKTAEELKATFGDDWRTKTRFGTAMDKYLGSPRSVYTSYPVYLTDNNVFVYEDHQLQKDYELYTTRTEEYGKRTIMTTSIDDFGTVLKRVDYTTKSAVSNTIVFWINMIGTGNCQVCYLVYFNRLLSLCEPLEIKELLDWLQPFIKKIAAFDVHGKYKTKIEQLNPMWLQPYTSTNGTPMIAGQLKLI